MNITRLFRIWSGMQSWRIGQWEVGKRLFSRLVRLFNPYTGALGADICSLEPGYARLSLSDRRRVRNHLNSIHAIALTNLGEFTSGLALLGLLTDQQRGIPVEIRSHYMKKARGTLTATSRVTLPEFTDDIEHKVVAEIKDTEGDIVAIIEATWKLGMIKAS